MNKFAVSILAAGAMIAASPFVLAGDNKDAPKAAESNAPTYRTAGPMPTDADLMKQLAVGGMAEVEAGKLATQKSNNAEVKNFGKKMVEDHGKSNEKLKSLATEKQVNLPTQVDVEHAAAKSKLETKNGAAFDADYMNAQVQNHERTVQLLKNQLGNGKDPGVKQFAEETLPTVEHHLKMARQLQAKVNAKADRSAASR